jgi:hypothetical protein
MFDFVAPFWSGGRAINELRFARTGKTDRRAPQAGRRSAKMRFSSRTFLHPGGEIKPLYHYDYSTSRRIVGIVSAVALKNARFCPTIPSSDSALRRDTSLRTLSSRPSPLPLELSIFTRFSLLAVRRSQSPMKVSRAVLTHARGRFNLLTNFRS